MTINRSYFYDNRAAKVTNGFQMTESTLDINDSKIDNCHNSPLYECSYDDFVDDISAIKPGEVLAGFFYLSSRSSLNMNRTMVMGLKGKTGAAVSLSTDSKIKAVRTQFKNLTLIDQTYE